MIRAGIPLTEIADHVGDSDAVLAKHYAHVIADMRGQPTMSVEDAITAARTQPRRDTSS